MKIIQNAESLQVPFMRFLFQDRRTAFLWLLVRLYVGYEWLIAGWEKVHSPLWSGSGAGGAVKGFVMGALQKTSGAHPDVQSWYAWFLQHAVLPHALLFSHLVAYGELLVGIGLIVGLFTGVAAFFGAFMNVNYLLAGTVSLNPQLLILQIFLLWAWRVAGWFGLDGVVLGRFFKHNSGATLFH